MCFQSQTQGLQGSGTASGKGIEKFRETVTQCAPDFGTGLIPQAVLRTVLPLHQLPEDALQTLTLCPLGWFIGKALGMGGRIIDQGRPEHGPGSSQGSSGPPQMQHRRVADVDGLLPAGGAIDV